MAEELKVTLRVLSSLGSDTLVRWVSADGRYCIAIVTDGLFDVDC